MVTSFSRWNLLLVLVVGLSAPFHSHAAKPLSTLGPDEMAAIFSALDQSTVTLVESEKAGQLIQATLATRVKARPETLFKAASTPEGYGKYFKNFEDIEVTDRHGDTVGFNWKWSGSKMSFKGRSMITLYPPNRLDMEILESAMGKGRIRIDVKPGPGNTTDVILAMRLDVETSNWIVRWLVNKHPIMKNAINLANGLVLIEGLKRGAEAMEQNRPIPAIHGKGGGAIRLLDQKTMEAFLPLLRRGSPGLVESSPGSGRLKSATALQTVYAPQAKVMDVINRPADYPGFMGLIRDVKVVFSDKTTTRFDWKMILPLSTMNSTCSLKQTAGGCSLAIEDGDMAGSRWLWQVFPRTPERSLLSLGGWADMEKTNFLFRAMLKKEPLFEHGLNLAASYVFTRRVRSKAEGWR